MRCSLSLSHNNQQHTYISTTKRRSVEKGRFSLSLTDEKKNWRQKIEMSDKKRKKCPKCDFFGSSEFMGYCSVCYKTLSEEEKRVYELVCIFQFFFETSFSRDFDDDFNTTHREKKWRRKRCHRRRRRIYPLRRLRNVC